MERFYTLQFFRTALAPLMNLRATEIAIAFYKEGILLDKRSLIYPFFVLDISARICYVINNGEKPNKIYYCYLVRK